MPEGSATGAPTYAYKRGPLYVKRKIANAADIHRWYSTQGVDGLLDPKDYHVTVVHSKEPVEWGKSWVAPEAMHVQGGQRSHDMFGPERDTFVLRFDSPELTARHKVFRQNGASHDFEEYHPHISLGKGMAVPLDSVEPYPGPLYLQPEEFMEPEGDAPVTSDQFEEKGYEPFIFAMPILIKAQEEDGRRIIEVEASCEKVDLEGDVILQKALLGSAANFVQRGHLDIDHKSEPVVARRLGIWNPEHFIIGRPLEVKDGGNGRTFVKGEIKKARDGTFDPAHRTYDMFWDSLTSTPPTIWYASVFGLPNKKQTHNGKAASEYGATRYLIEGMEWRSLALTKNPVCNGITGNAEIITAKAWIDELSKSTLGAPVGGLGAIDAKSMLAHGLMCQKCGYVLKNAPSVPAWRRHLMECKAMDPDTADLCAHGLEYKRLLG